MRFHDGFPAEPLEQVRSNTTTSTFTIAATDGRDWGVAVASRVLAVGGIVPAVESMVGAIATQATVNVAWKADGLRLLRSDESARSVVQSLVASDATPEGRQVAVVDRRGGVAAYTGPGCRAWAGHSEGTGFVVAGNILAGPQVVTAIVESFRGATGELALRLVTAVRAGDLAGGDSRGRQSAAVVVARSQGGIEGLDDRLLDLRVDDHSDPVGELMRLVQLGIAEYQRGFAEPADE